MPQFSQSSARRALCSVIGLGLLVGCGGGGASSEKEDLSFDAGPDASECPSQVVESGVCMPEAPRPAQDCPAASTEGVCDTEGPRWALADDCVGGVVEDGVCQPIAPAAPDLPDWECPQGWTSSTIAESLPDDLDELDVPDGLTLPTICRATTPPDTCAPGTMPVVGFDTCQPIGSNCPLENEAFPSEENLRLRAGDGFDGTIYYVGSGAAGIPSGTRLNPWPTVAEALEVAVDGDIIALAAEPFSDTVNLESRVALIGACARETELIAQTLDEDNPSVRITGPGTVVADMTLSGPRSGVWVTATDGPTRIDGVEVVGAVGRGIWLAGDVADTLVRSTWIHDTTPWADDVTSGVGLVAQFDAVARLEEVALTGNTRNGLLVQTRGHVEADQIYVAGNLPQPDEAFGAGIHVQGESSLSASRALLVDNAQFQLYVHQESMCDGSDIELVGAQPASGGELGIGIRVLSGGALSLERTVVVDARLSAIAVSEGSLEATDVALIGTRVQDSDGGFGISLGVDTETIASVDRLVVARSAGVAVRNTSALLTITDGAIVGSLPHQVQSGGLITLSGGVDTTLSRVVVHDSADIGIIGEAGGMLTLTDVTVSRVVPGPVFDGWGVAWNGTSGSAERLHVADSQRVGLLALGPDTTLDLSDVRITDTTAAEELAYGMQIEVGTEVTAQRLRFERSAIAHIAVLGPGHLTVTDLWTDEVGPANPEQNTFAMYVSEGGEVDVTRAHLSGHDAQGIVTELDGSHVVLRDVLIDEFLPAAGRTEVTNGLGVLPDTSMELERVVVSSAGFGATTYENGVLTAYDLTLVGNEEVGLWMMGTSTLDRVSLVDNPGIGVVVASGETTVRNLVATNNGFISPETIGGIGMLEGLLDIQYALFEGNHQVGGFYMLEGGELIGRDMIIRNTQGQFVTGYGFAMLDGGVADIERVLFQGNKLAGMIIAGRCQLTGRDVTILDTVLATCDDDCPIEGGFGLAATEADISLERFLLSGNELAGMALHQQNDLDARNGLITENVIGINVQDEAFDIDEAFDNVVAFDNVTDFDSQNLKVPGADDVLGEIDTGR